MLEIPAELELALVPMAFLIGHWTGDGVGAGADGVDFAFRQELEIAVVRGAAVLSHSSVLTPVDGGPDLEESGFWRPGEGLTEVELLLTHGGGWLEMGYGSVTGLRVETATRAVMFSDTGQAVHASRRLYGRVEDDLAYVVELAPESGPLMPHRSARLRPAGES